MYFIVPDLVFPLYQNYYTSMGKFGSECLIPFDSEIEGACHRSRKEKRLAVNQSQEDMDDHEGARATDNVVGI